MSLKAPPKKGSNANKAVIAALVLIAVALVFLVIGIAMQPKYKAMAEYPEMKADVTQVYENRDDDNHNLIESYTIHVAFTIDGKSYSRAFTVGSDPGDNVTIRYNPQDPGEFHLASDPPKKTDMFYLTGIFGVLGLIVLFGALSERKKARKGADENP
jgi:hypothetical protein